MWSDENKVELFGHNSRMYGEKETVPMRKGTPFPQSNMVEVRWCFGGVCLHQTLDICMKGKE